MGYSINLGASKFRLPVLALPPFTYLGAGFFRLCFFVYTFLVVQIWCCSVSWRFADALYPCGFHSSVPALLEVFVLHPVVVVYGAAVPLHSTKLDFYPAASCAAQWPMAVCFQFF